MRKPGTAHIDRELDVKTRIPSVKKAKRRMYPMKWIKWFWR